MLSGNTGESSYEVVVIGLGLVGSSALYEAAEILNRNGYAGLTQFDRNPRVLGLEQHELLHDQGSSHGETRITRLAIAEGSAYVPLAKKSQKRLRELQEKVSDRFGRIYHENNTGILILGSLNSGSTLHGTNGFLQATREVAHNENIPHINYQQQNVLAHAFPQLNFSGDQQAYLEHTMGILNPEACIKAQIYLAKQANADVRANEVVLGFRELNNGKILVETDKKQYTTNKLIITTGPWISKLVPFVQEKLKVYRQVVFYFQVEKEFRDQYRVGTFHPFIWDLGSNRNIYGFPIMQPNATAIKIGFENSTHVVTPETVDRSVSKKEIEEMFERFVKPNFKGVTSVCEEAFVCLYTSTPNGQFLIDYLPNYEEQILFASACSGHGAKHALAVGAGLAQQILVGRSDDNILQFNLAAMEGRNNHAEKNLIDRIN